MLINLKKLKIYQNQTIPAASLNVLVVSSSRTTPVLKPWNVDFLQFYVTRWTSKNKRSPTTWYVNPSSYRLREDRRVTSPVEMRTSSACKIANLRRTVDWMWNVSKRCEIQGSQNYQYSFYIVYIMYIVYFMNWQELFTIDLNLILLKYFVICHQICSDGITPIVIMPKTYKLLSLKQGPCILILCFSR